MGVLTTSCVTVSCDRCMQLALGYEETITLHFDDVDAARKSLVDDWDEEPESQWQVTEDGEWICPSCVAARVCEAAGGHDYGPWDENFSGSSIFRSCRRGHCDASERRPIEDVTPL